MPSSRHILALLRTHIAGDDARFFSAALQAAADEARSGHAHVAKELRDLVERGRSRSTPESGTTALLQPRGELAALLSVSYPSTKLTNMVLELMARERIERVLLEQRQSRKLEAYNLAPRRKLLLVGPPGSGKTMTANAIAGELKLPLFTILLEGLITKFLGETAQKLRLVFDAIAKTRGVYLFDEFDAIGTRRTSGNDVGEIRRVLNSFLQFFENDASQSIIVAATNHPELLDRALFRRFDDLLEYRLPSETQIGDLIKSRLHGFSLKSVDWDAVVHTARGLSQADLTRTAGDSAKLAILRDSKSIATVDILDALKERIPVEK